MMDSAQVVIRDVLRKASSTGSISTDMVAEWLGWSREICCVVEVRRNQLSIAGDREIGRTAGSLEMELRREASVLLFVAVWFDCDEGGAGGKRKSK